MSSSMKESLEKLQTQQIASSVSDAVSQNTMMRTPAMLMRTSTEPELTVDMDARTITVPDELKNIGVIYDNNAETIYIRIPSTTFDDITLTDKTAYIEFINAGGNFYTYEAQTEVEGDTIKLGWTIENNVTAYAGTVRFQLTFELGDDYKWSTLPASFNVLDGLSASRTISASETNLAASLINRANEAIRLANSNDSELSDINDTIEQIQDKIATLQEKVEYLENHVVYIFENIEQGG